MFLPTTKKDLKKRGWKQLDIILVSGDAYVDHPSFGPAIIGRYLEEKGYKVGIIAQPRIKSNNFEDFKRLGKPKLFWGITSGNMDSIVANYTARRKVRNDDSYSNNGKAFYKGSDGKEYRYRPDRAAMRYTQIIKRIYNNPVTVLGGVEASLRRFSHFDYLQNKIRHSILVDTKADILVYGMGEKAIAEIAERIENNEKLYGIRGTVIKSNNKDDIKKYINLPSNDDLKNEKSKLIEQYLKIKKNTNYYCDKKIIEKDSVWYLIQFPPQKHLNTEELDKIYELPFEREIHPSYDRIPAFDMIKNSITSHRGCSGGCNFCSIGMHQGQIIRSRSKNSILKEIEVLKNKDYFKGHLTDIGGPSADMYKTRCKIDGKGCKRLSCMFPKRCENLITKEKEYISFLEQANKKVKKISIGSGLRLDLSMKYPEIIEKIVKKFVSGYLNVAPEHITYNVLKHMGKFRKGVFENFIGQSKKILRKYSAILKPYFIAGHPGATKKDTDKLASYLNNKNIKVDSVQEFVPSPMTLSTAMYYASKDKNGNKLSVMSPSETKKAKRKIISN